MNYYAIDTSGKCGSCGRGVERLHIGKSSYGWVFSLHVIPERSINSYDDWNKLFEVYEIVDECDKVVTAEDMRSVITGREAGKFAPQGIDPIRHSIDGFCIGHGSGTWDHMVGEFS